MIKFLLLLIVVSIGIPEYSFAYIDPGSSSIIIQTIIAGLIGLGLFFKNIVYYLKSKKDLYLKKKNEEHKNEEMTTEQPQNP